MREKPRKGRKEFFIGTEVLCKGIHSIVVVEVEILSGVVVLVVVVVVVVVVGRGAVISWGVNKWPIVASLKEWLMRIVIVKLGNY